MKVQVLCLEDKFKAEIRVWRRGENRYTMSREGTIIEMGTAANAANIIAINYFVGDSEWESLSEDAREAITKGLTEKFLNILELMR